MKFLSSILIGWEKIQAFFCRYLGRNYKCDCGHGAKWKTILTIDGCSGVFTVPSKTPEYCPKCFEKAVIKCAWCGEPILPGDPITLYSSGFQKEPLFSSVEQTEAQQKRRREDFAVPEHAVVYRQEPHLILVGCLRCDCADTGGDRAGFWVMPGKVQRVATVMEMLMAIGGEDPIIVEDLTDSRQAMYLSDEKT